MRCAWQIPWKRRVFADPPRSLEAIPEIPPEYHFSKDYGWSKMLHGTRQCVRQAREGEFCMLHARSVRLAKLRTAIDATIQSMRASFLQMPIEGRQDALRAHLEKFGPEIGGLFADLLAVEEWVLPRPEPTDLEGQMLNIQHGLGGLLVIFDLDIGFEKLAAQLEEAITLQLELSRLEIP